MRIQYQDENGNLEIGEFCYMYIDQNAVILSSVCGEYNDMYCDDPNLLQRYERILHQILQTGFYDLRNYTFKEMESQE